MAIAWNVALRQSDGTDYDQRIHIETNITNVIGLLGNDDKIKTALLPTFLIGGMKYIGAINSNMATETLLGEIDTWLDATGGDKTDHNFFKGKYFVITTNGIKITPNQDTTPKHYFIAPDDSSSSGVSAQQTLEAGDWVVYNHYDDAHYWAIMNNKYGDATSTTKGVVKLADESDGGITGNGNDVITKDLLQYADVGLLGGKASSAFMEKSDYLDNGRVKVGNLPTEIAYKTNANTFIQDQTLNKSLVFAKKQALGEDFNTITINEISPEGDYNYTLSLPIKNGVLATIGDTKIPVVTSENDLDNLPKTDGLLAFLKTGTYEIAGSEE